MATNSSNPRILIPFDVIEDHLHCSICLSVIRGAVLTPCGHRYCNKCITEWTGRNHTCPCCNSNLTTGQFHYDVHFDNLVEDILLARDKAEENHFSQIFNEGTKDDAETKISPFQEVFKRHVKASLVSFEKYFHKLHEDHKRQIRLLEATVYNNVNEEDKKKALEEKLKLSETLALESFDRYLSTNIPQFEVLPVMVSVYILEKNIRIPNVILQPKDSVAAIKSPIEKAMQIRLDSILRWRDEGEKLFLFGPLAKCEEYELDSLMNGSNSCVSLSWQSLPVFQHNLLPGSEIVLCDAFESESDQPKQCFTQVFQKGGNLAVDYFFCQSCNVKWICKSCSQYCHADHNLVNFSLNHRPTWACCYCPKNKLCKFLQSPTPQNKSVTGL